MADTTTTVYGLTKPEVGASEDTWGEKLNTNLDALDDLLSGSTTLQGAKLDDTTQIVDNADATKIVALSAGSLTTATTRTFTFPDATGTFVLADNTATLTNKTLTSPAITGSLSVAAVIAHTGDTDNNIEFGTDTQTFDTGAVSRLDISNSGVRIGTGARVTTILDEDAMGSDSATALATQQSIKAYVDTFTGEIIETGGGSAPYYGARAWVVTESSAFVDGDNIASTIAGGGSMRCTFTTAMPNADYCVVGGSVGAGSQTRYFVVTAQTATYFDITEGAATAGRLFAAVFA